MNPGEETTGGAVGGPLGGGAERGSESGRPGDGSESGGPGNGAESRPGSGPGGSRRPLRPDLLHERLVVSGPVDRLQVVDRAGSTNTDLAAALRADPAAWGDVGVLVTEHQVEGRGRSGRAWQTPPAAALTFSIALRPPAGPEAVGWLPLLAGLAVVRAIRTVSEVPVALKWPNDLMVDVPGAVDLDGWGTERKVGGILAELVPTPGGTVVVVGIGVNVSQTADELPVPSALSLAGARAAAPAATAPAATAPAATGTAGGGAAGGDDAGALRGPDPLDRDALLVAGVEQLTTLVEQWQRAGGDVGAAGLVGEVAAVCTTLGRSVRAELPGDRELVGTAVGLGTDGSLLVRDAADEVHAVRAGDVRHVRAGGSER
jgi:BirA family transcriptional regulator, biotin operon repressor / biotin---[acetyl-CoA-carboxylase] ligase